jgi:hypothetical protein
MDRIAKQSLIHTADCFSRTELERRRVQYKFAHLAKVEAFAWDLELYGQLQHRFDGHVVLKGGAAAQLFFPIAVQRNSVDIDVTTDLTAAEFEKGLREIEKKLCPEGSVCAFKEYVPVQPRDGLKLTRYTIDVPSVCTAQERYGSKDPTVQPLNVDVLFGILPKDHFVDKSTSTFALDLAFSARVPAPDALFGDKLLTLAATTVGIPDARAADRCKQLYDLHRLVSLNLLSDVLEIQQSFELVMETQHQIRSQEGISLDDAIIDVEDFLQKAKLLDFHDPLQLWQKLHDFQLNFVGVDARMQREVWVIGIEALRLLAEGLVAQRRGSDVDAVKLLNRARALERSVEAAIAGEDNPGERVNKVKKLQQQFEEFCQRKKIRSRFRGRSPRRILWYLVTPENIDELAEAVR